MVSYIDNLQLPQVLHTLQCSVTTWQKVGQIFMQAEAVQPGGEGCAAITAQCLHLHWRERHVKKSSPVALGCSDKIRTRKMQRNLNCIVRSSILTNNANCWTLFVTTLSSFLQNIRKNTSSNGRRHRQLCATRKLHSSLSILSPTSSRGLGDWNIKFTVQAAGINV